MPKRYAPQTRIPATKKRDDANRAAQDHCEKVSGHRTARAGRLRPFGSAPTAPRSPGLLTKRLPALPRS